VSSTSPEPQTTATAEEFAYLNDNIYTAFSLSMFFIHLNQKLIAADYYFFSSSLLLTVFHIYQQSKFR
jgi:hypothetical protein